MFRGQAHFVAVRQLVSLLIRPRELAWEMTKREVSDRYSRKMRPAPVDSFMAGKLEPIINFTSGGALMINTSRLDIFDIPARTDLHHAFDFSLCWGLIVCTHDPKTRLREEVVHELFRKTGFTDIVTLNKAESHDAAWHVLGCEET